MYFPLPGTSGIDFYFPFYLSVLCGHHYKGMSYCLTAGTTNLITVTHWGQELSNYFHLTIPFHQKAHYGYAIKHFLNFIFILNSWEYIRLQRGTFCTPSAQLSFCLHNIYLDALVSTNLLIILSNTVKGLHLEFFQPFH